MGLIKKLKEDQKLTPELISEAVVGLVKPALSSGLIPFYLKGLPNPSGVCDPEKTNPPIRGHICSFQDHKKGDIILAGKGASEKYYEYEKPMRRIMGFNHPSHVEAETEIRTEINKRMGALKED